MNNSAVQAIRVWQSTDAARSTQGPPVAHYALFLDLPGVPYRWAPGSSAVEDAYTAIVPTGGGAAGAWLRTREDDQGETIAATATIKVGGKRWRRIPVGALSANATLTLSTENAVAGDWIEFTRLDVGAYTVAIVNGGAGAGTLVTFPVSARAHAVAYFNGTDWLVRDSHLMI